jgi:hypothetical protein
LVGILNVSHSRTDRRSQSSWHGILKSPINNASQRLLILLLVAGLLLLVVLSGIAFGPSGAAFGAIACTAAITLMMRRYRFGLRTFLLLVTLLSVWLGLKVRRDAHLNQALAHIQSSGGQLEVIDRRSDFPWGLWKYRYRLGYNTLGKTLSNDDFRPFEQFVPSSFESLNLTNTGISDEGLSFIRGLTGLKVLFLPNETYASGSVIPGKPINDITSDGLKQLVDLQELIGIDLRGTGVDDEAMTTMVALQQLRWIHLDGTPVSGVTLSDLSGLPQLSSLELNGCVLDPEAYEKLGELRNLRSLGLRSTPITDADLKVLERNTSLSLLRLNDTGVSKAAVEKFKAAHPNCIIER